MYGKGGLTDYLITSVMEDRLYSRRKQKMKGYATSEGYMGLVQGRYMIFASEVDYREYMED